jgi:hypothetical protein
MKLEWQSDLDEEGNTYWYASSPYAEEEDGCPFAWQLKQRLKDNKIQWYEDHDPELMASDPERSWACIDQAKSDVEKDHFEIMEGEGLSSE